jgi:sigma-54 dependent transcriptional regulator, acetoin dehydrogenase operon transcriptional activator AcoR
MNHPQARLDAIESARQSVIYEGRMTDRPLVQDWIERSWRRCLAQGQRPQDAIEFDQISESQIKSIREINRNLLEAASPELDKLSRAIAGTRYFALLTDIQGIVIDTRGEIDKQNKHASSIGRIGVDLSEKRVGTTAIGTVLTELKPVWLHRGEHFYKSTSMYSCAGAPVFGPDGSCVGMLDLTGVNTPERPELKFLAAQSARSIENSLLRNQQANLQIYLNWPGRLQGNDSDGLISLDENGHIIGANRQARQMISIDHLHPHASDVFAMPWQSLFDLAHTQTGAEVPLWSGLRIQIKAAGEACPRPTFMTGSNAGALKDVESDLIRRVMQQSRGNVAEAAKRLGISRATLYRKIAPPRKNSDAAPPN